VVANLSRFVNYAELDLSAFKGMVPVELFGYTRFPAIGELPYFLTLGPHSFYWFKLEQPRISEARAAAEGFEPPRLEVADSWENILQGRARTALERILPAYLLSCRWFGGKAQPIRLVKNIDMIPFSADSITAFFTTWEVQYIGKTPETYLLPLAFAAGDRAFELRQANPQAVIAQLKLKEENLETEGILYDAIYNPQFCKSLLPALERSRRSKGGRAEIHSHPSRKFRALAGDLETPLEPALLKAEQSNTSLIYGDRLIFKLFRRVTEGINPDVEIGRFLTEKTSFAYVPPLAGFFEIRKGPGEPATIGILQALVPNQGDAWRYTLDSLGRYFEEVLSHQLAPQEAAVPDQRLAELAAQETPPLVQELMGGYLSSARLLGQRTGELHIALASDAKDPVFAPEPFTALYRRSLYQSLRTLADQSLSLLQQRLRGLSPEVRAEAEKVLKLEGAIFDRLRRIVDKKMTGMRIRGHGDFHLGQVLFTGKDFVIIDFEGEPVRPITERRLKRSPLRDVAAMLRSFNYAALSKLRNDSIRPEDAVQLRPWARFWDFWVSVNYLRGYFSATASSSFMPKSQDELSLMLSAYTLEKAVYELGYELNNRPNWVDIPIAGILELMKSQEARE
jgi:maltose alpha-D-glucosyltransferase / alpha-amylase